MRRTVWLLCSFVMLGALGIRAAEPPTAAGCIDVERATAKELEQLKGVGPALAKAIIDHRKAQRAKATKAGKPTWTFGNWARLMKVKGVGEQICRDNLDRVCFSGKRQRACPRAGR